MACKAHCRGLQISGLAIKTVSSAGNGIFFGPLPSETAIFAGNRHYFDPLPAPVSALIDSQRRRPAVFLGVRGFPRTGAVLALPFRRFSSVGGRRAPRLAPRTAGREETAHSDLRTRDVRKPHPGLRDLARDQKRQRKARWVRQTRSHLPHHMTTVTVFARYVGSTSSHLPQKMRPAVFRQRAAGRAARPGGPAQRVATAPRGREVRRSGWLQHREAEQGGEAGADHGAGDGDPAVGPHAVTFAGDGKYGVGEAGRKVTGRIEGIARGTAEGHTY